jgi:hypothetical protein
VKQKDSSLLRMDNFMSGSHNLCLTCGVKVVLTYMYVCIVGGLLAYKVVPLVPIGVLKQARSSNKRIHFKCVFIGLVIASYRTCHSFI